MPVVPGGLPVLVIGAVVVVTLVGWVAAPVRNALVFNPYRVRHRGEIHRLLGGAFLHADITHLAFNMFALYTFGEQAVHALGDTRFLALYLSACLVAHLPSLLLHMNDKRYNSLGASGAVAAVMFAVILLVPKTKLRLMFLPFDIPGVAFAIGYLLYSAWHARRRGDNVNHEAHFAGAVYGAAFAYIVAPHQVERTLHSFF